MLWVHRKGATPAYPGQRGFVGGTICEPAVILRGVGSERSAEALYSTVHGAGRVLSRKKASGKTRIVSKWRCRDYRKCDFAGAKGGFSRGPNGETPTCPKCGHKLVLERMKQQLSPGFVDYGVWQERLAKAGIELRGGGADEAPECYKRLGEVLAYHEGTVEVDETLYPIGVAMAGEDVYDPFKD